MSKLDELKNKAKDLVSGNRDKIESGLEKAGDLVNQKTGGKHGDKIDKGLDKVTQGLDKVAGDQTADPGGLNPPAPNPIPLATAPVVPPAPNSYSAPMATGPAEPPQPTTPPVTPG